MSSLREQIRDQKYPNGFMTTDFPKIGVAGMQHQEMLEKTSRVYDGIASTTQWERIPGSNCLIRSIS